MSSSNLADRVVEEVKKAYPNHITCTIIDHSDGCGAKLELTIVDDSFDGVPILKRHRAINNLMKDRGLWEELHALQVKAWTGKQWEEKKSS